MNVLSVTVAVPSLWMAPPEPQSAKFAAKELPITVSVPVL